MVCLAALGEQPSGAKTDDAEMVLVPAGPFMMGSLDGDSDEAPPHVKNLPAFYIDKFEVTHERYAKFLAATGRKPPVDWPDGKMPEKPASHPVVNVTFADAEAYASWAGKRLPTEAEWEKAARGSDGRIYPWGNSLSGKKTATPVGDNARDHTYPVGSFADDVSPFGAMDMAGNVCEWTTDWYDAYPGSDEKRVEFGKKYRVIRGGGAIEYYAHPFTLRSAQRGYALPYGTSDGLGFRCVLDATKVAKPKRQ
jgi:gamma-glutamyl hercynylcysteine S-oxide synthase